MRKFLVLLFALMLVSSLPAYSYATQTYETPDTVWGDSSLGWARTRDFNNYDDIHINTLNPHNDSRSVMIPLVDTMPFGQLHWWLLYCKSSFWTNGICTDSVFIHDQFGYGSEVSYWFYIPAGAPIDSFIVFNRDSDWSWCTFGKYMPGDLTFGAWNNLIAPCPETIANGDTIDLPIIQFDIWIYTDSLLLNPSCTLYMDDVESRLGGIEEEVAASALTIGTSINSIKFSMTNSEPVVVSCFRIDGSKVFETAGTADAGSNEVSVGNLPAGVYIVRVIGRSCSGTGKLLIM